MSFECGQQRVMRPGWERPRPLASWRVLTNRMREYFTYGSVGGAGGNSGPYPADEPPPRFSARCRVAIRAYRSRSGLYFRRRSLSFALN